MMQILHASSPSVVSAMGTPALRSHFLLEQLFEPDRVRLTYSHYDRMIVGGVMPVDQIQRLDAPPALRADHFLERREMGIINIGGPGRITTESGTYNLSKLDCLYLGRGTKEVHFQSHDPADPALFYLLSAPAHRTCPACLMPSAEANPNRLGTQSTANARTIFKYIHPDGIESCQLVMGLTVLEPGSVWNTMPPHTHDRRMEVYCYFDVPDGQRVLHLMGDPAETRHLWIGNLQGAISPPWSIHAGCGTMAYSFIWGMAGENQSFADMDQIAVDALQ